MSKQERVQKIEQHKKSLNTFGGNTQYQEESKRQFTGYQTGSNKWQYDEDEENTPSKNPDVELKQMTLEMAAGEDKDVKESPM